MIERKIIIGLITSTEYIQKILPVWDIKLLESSMAKRLAQWVFDYYTKYAKAPNKDIEGIYYQKLEEGLPKDIAEEIEEDILPGLSDEYERTDFNLQYLLDQTFSYFHNRQIQIRIDEIEVLRRESNLQEAGRLLNIEAPIVTDELDPYICTIEEMLSRQTELPHLIIKPWLREGETTIIYGNYGTGKSLLAILIGYLVGLRDFSNSVCDIGEWQVKQATGCLYIDGELGRHSCIERIGQFQWLGAQRSRMKIRVFTFPEYQLETEKSMYLSDRRNQLKIIQWLKRNPCYRLVVIDSASTVFEIENENDNSEWNKKISPFIRDLRALRVANIILHHCGKDGKLRGASAIGAMAQNIFRLQDHPAKDIDEGEAWFILSKNKQRAAGRGFKKFAMRFFKSTDSDGTEWETSTNLS